MHLNLFSEDQSIKGVGVGKKCYSALSDENMISSSQEPETSQRDTRTNSQPAINSKKIIGGCEIKPVCMLVNLEKKPLECYFEGLKGKPSRRRKVRPTKKKCLDFWDSDSSSASRNGGWISTLAGAPLKEREQHEVEDILLGHIIETKVKTYEKLKEHKQEKISMKQRLAEESYLEQQENLAETWLGIMKRRSQLRNAELERFPSCPRSTFRTSSSKHYTRIEISLLSKKLWRDEKEEVSLQKKEEPSVVDNLGDVFGEKLVFIDDED